MPTASFSRYDRRVGMERMTSGGKRLAFIIGVVLALALPRRVEHGVVMHGKESCTAYEIEPWGVYLLENVVGHLGIGYSSGEDCR
jgi:hypothetical protein